MSPTQTVRTLIQSYTQIGGDPAVASNELKIDTDAGVVNKAATTGCAASVVANKTCYFNCDWSAFATDLKAYTTAVQAVDNTAKICFLNENFTETISGIGDLSYFGTKVAALSLSSACTSDDRIKYLAYIANATVAQNPKMANVSLGFDVNCVP
jgi:hypothetical protein